MAKVFTKPYPDGFKNKPDKTTPITAEVMDTIQNGIDAIDNKVVELENSATGGGSEIVDYEGGRREVGVLGNRPVYEEHFEVDSISATETSITPDTAFYRLLSAYGTADHNVSKNDVSTQRISIPYSLGEEYAHVMEDDSVKSSKKLILRTDSVDYSRVNIATRYLGKLQISNPCTWADGTDEEIATLLEAHYDGDFNVQDVWNVGDERKFVLGQYKDFNGGTIVESQYSLILLNKGGRLLDDGQTDCAFVVGFSNKIRGDWRSQGGQTNKWSTDEKRLLATNRVYNAIPQNVRNLLRKHINKQTACATSNNETATVDTSIDYIAPPDEFEVFGTNEFTLNISEQSHLEWFKNSNNLTRTLRFNDNSSNGNGWMFRSKAKQGYGFAQGWYWKSPFAGVNRSGQAVGSVNYSTGDNQLYFTGVI